MAIRAGQVASAPLLIAGLLILAGFGYKISAVPFHFWTPDVYQGAPTTITAFLSVASKAAGFAMAIRFFKISFIDVSQYVEGASTYAVMKGFDWPQIIAIVSVLTMTLGNLVAVWQSNLKRLLAYSSIAHAGYLMIGILSVNRLGLASAVYYMLGYLLMNLACFYVIYQLAPEGENLDFDSLSGLYRRSPLLAFTLAAAAFGLTGIPPTIGFTGKFLIFTAAFQKGFHLLVVIAVVNAAISLFFYLKMVRAAYIQVENPGDSLSLSFPQKILGVFFIASIILTGILPQGFIALAEKAVAGLH